MAGKKYFWYKLSEDFYKKQGMQAWRNTLIGCMTIVFYECLVLETLNSGCILSPGKYDRLNMRALSQITGMGLWKVCIAYYKLRYRGLLNRLPDGSILLNEAGEYIDSETDSAERMRRYREKTSDAAVTQSDKRTAQRAKRTAQSDKRPLQSDADQDQDQDPDQDPDQDKERESDIVIDPPSLEVVSEYARKLGIEGDAQAFYDYNTARGWRIDGEGISDWQAALRMWVRRMPGFAAMKPEGSIWDEDGDIKY